MPGRIHVEKEGALGWLIFDHPERRNAISHEMWEALPKAARALDEDPAVRVVILRGAGNIAFVSGADISEFEGRRTGGDAAATYEETSVRAFASISEICKPVLVLIHGFCVGGGLATALAADLRYAAAFGIRASHGRIPGHGAGRGSARRRAASGAQRHPPDALIPRIRLLREKKAIPCRT